MPKQEINFDDYSIKELREIVKKANNAIRSRGKKHTKIWPTLTWYNYNKNGVLEYKLFVNKQYRTYTPNVNRWYAQEFKYAFNNIGPTRNYVTFQNNVGDEKRMTVDRYDWYGTPKDALYIGTYRESDDKKKIQGTSKHLQTFSYKRIRYNTEQRYTGTGYPVPVVYIVYV